MTDDKPSIAELQRLAGVTSSSAATALREAAPVLLEIAAAALVWLDDPAKGFGSHAEHALAEALAKVRP